MLMKNKKALTAVIALMLLLMMTVAGTAGFFYTFSQVIQTKITNYNRKNNNRTAGKHEKIVTSCINVESASGNKIYLRNCGKGEIPPSSLKIYIDGIPVDYKLTSSIGEKEVKAVVLKGLWKFSSGRHMLKVVAGNIKLDKSIELVPHPSAILVLNLDEPWGKVIHDSSNEKNEGEIQNFEIIGDFEGSADGFNFDCGGSPAHAFEQGIDGKSIKLWPTGGDGLACMNKPVGSVKKGETFYFYAQGKNIFAQIWCGYTNSKLYVYEDGVWNDVGYHTLDDWKLHKLVVQQDDWSNCGILALFFRSVELRIFRSCKKRRCKNRWKIRKRCGV